MKNFELVHLHVILIVKVFGLYGNLVLIHYMLVTNTVLNLVIRCYSMLV